jgi:cysteine synthase A
MHSSSLGPTTNPAAIRQGFCSTIGNTPLIELTTLSRLTGCRILGKAEFLNPGGSVKDRAALGIIQDAEAKGLLQPGALIVEGTAGNTGIGLTLVAQSKGYRSLIVVPETQSAEKLDMLRAVGADLRLVPAAPYSDPGNFNHVAKRLAESIPGAFWANQFDNPANAKMHKRTTGPEILDQTQGQVSAFICSVGTGGTLAGVSQSLKEQLPGITIGCVDPGGAAMYSWFTHGHLEDVTGGSVTEGIGQNRVTANVARAQVDCAFRIMDHSVLAMTHYLLKFEGLFLGSTSGINVCGALKMAARLGPGHTIVTILCDSATRYLSRLFNDAWLAEKNLLEAAHRGRTGTEWMIQDLGPF